jgi:hypothetical protein
MKFPIAAILTKKSKSKATAPRLYAKVTKNTIKKGIPISIVPLKLFPGLLLLPIFLNP